MVVVHPLLPTDRGEFAARTVSAWPGVGVGPLLDVPLDPPEPEDEDADEHDHEHHHHHHHGHAHDHEEEEPGQEEERRRTVRVTARPERCHLPRSRERPRQSTRFARAAASVAGVWRTPVTSC